MSGEDYGWAGLAAFQRAVDEATADATASVDPGVSVNIPPGVSVSVHVDGTHLPHSIQLTTDGWRATVTTKVDQRRSPWDYMDDGPSGPELVTRDLAEAVAFVRDTSKRELARRQAEQDAKDAELDRAAKEASNARRRAARAAKRS